jgi:hypothetical protein
MTLQGLPSSASCPPSRDPVAAGGAVERSGHHHAGGVEPWCDDGRLGFGAAIPRAQRSTLKAMRAVARTARYWGPLFVGFMCLIAVQFVGPVIGLLLLILSSFGVSRGVMVGA